MKTVSYREKTELMPDKNLVYFQTDTLIPKIEVAAYVERMQAQGLPDTHRQLLEELQGWLRTGPEASSPRLEAFHEALEAEGSILMDSSIVGAAAEHLAFLYRIVGDIFAARNGKLAHALERAAGDAVQRYEEAIQQYMQDTGCDRLEALQYMEGSALARLQERQESVMSLTEKFADEVLF